jgi:hypothetical protein
MDVHVHAVQDELPAGLAKMLNILTDTIKAPVESGGALPPPHGGGGDGGN